MKSLNRFIRPTSLIQRDEEQVKCDTEAKKCRNVYNINADTMAAELASEIKADKLLLMTDTPGILRSRDDLDTLIPELSVVEAQKLIEEQVIQGGMIPKVQCCIRALSNGTAKAVILNGMQEHSLLLETFTDQGCGTLIKKL